MRHRYYYTQIQRLLKFLIPPGKSILYFGCYREDVIYSLDASSSVVINEEVDERISKNKSVEFVHCKYHLYNPQQEYDYIILDTVIGKTENINLLLRNISSACSSHTRIIIHQENYLWRPLLNFAASFGLKKQEKTQNWLSIKDVETYLETAGFESTRVYKKNIFPLKAGFLGPILNHFFSTIPVLDFLKLDQFIVGRFNKPFTQLKSSSSLSICLTVKDEEHNIEPIVSSLPVLCENQEILFVEGNSTDNTAKEIERMKMLFPHKNIRLIKQPGKGQGDAIHTGFKEAKGEIIILYEGDGTSEPYDIQYFYEAIEAGRFEFIEGSRFVYPLSHKCMPLANKIGNVVFAKWFSFFLNQRTTDVLSGIKAIRKKDYEKIYNTWGFLGIPDPFGDFELLFGSARYGLKIGEIPIRYKPRVFGESKTSVFKHGWYLLKMAFTGYFIFRNSKVREQDINITRQNQPLSFNGKSVHVSDSQRVL